ncbi:MAG: hypothetical protein ABNH21_06600 [Glaciecola sp.]|jgi:hypothetical protein
MATDGKRKIFMQSMVGMVIEGLATADVRPGSIVEQSASGIAESNDIDAIFNQQTLFADYDQLGAGDVDTVIASGSTVLACPLPKGCAANVLVNSLQNITKKGMGLAPAGNGTLKLAAADGTDKVVAYSDEIINTGGSVTLVKVKGA